MPWKASSVMEERLRFVARLLDGEAMTECAGSSASPARPATRFSTATMPRDNQGETAASIRMRQRRGGANGARA